MFLEMDTHAPNLHKKWKIKYYHSIFTTNINLSLKILCSHKITFVVKRDFLPQNFSQDRDFFFIMNSFFCHKYYSLLKFTFSDKKFYSLVKLFSDGLVAIILRRMFFVAKNICQKNLTLCCKNICCETLYLL